MAIESPLFQSAMELLGHSITHFNGTSELDRKLVILHLSNSVELLLKDIVLDGGDSIYKNPKETITIHGCIEALNSRKITVPHLNKLELLIDERNALQHRFGSPNELTTIFYMNVALDFFRSTLKQLPSVFVGCPYGGKFPFQAFKATLDRLPFRWYYAGTNVTTKHLLGILTSYIKSVDYCIFDISLWNANVALEIGLAEGLGVEYYILLNKNLSKGVPADIQGLQRIEYDSPKGFKSGDLLPSIVKYFAKEYTHPRNVYNSLGTDNRGMKYYFALGVIAHLRDNKRFTHEDGVRLTRGTYLRKEAKDGVLDLLQSSGLIGAWGTKKGATLKKNLYPEVLKLG